MKKSISFVLEIAEKCPTIAVKHFVNALNEALKLLLTALQEGQFYAHSREKDDKSSNTFISNLSND